MGAIPMPQKVREYRIKHNLPVPDPNIPYIIVPQEDIDKNNQQQ